VTQDASQTLDVEDGAGRAFESFVVEHRIRLVRLAAMVCGDLGEAEDIVQTALLRAWRSRSALRDDARLRPWLDRIVVREASRERRFRVAWLGRLVRSDRDDASGAEGPELVDEVASRFPERLALRQAFERLGPRHRAVVVLHLHAGYTLADTAEILGIPQETARSRMRVARDHLRGALAGGPQ
jgi:RNA polymerase sigma-70 factor (ECF subfamily)